MLDHQETVRSPLNSSTSKYLFSFPKESRFKGRMAVSQSTQVFYNLPTLLSKRGAGFGYGRKELVFPNTHNDSPPPNKYVLQSEVDEMRRSRKGVKISEKLSSSSSLRNANQPGPATYNNLGEHLCKNGVIFNRQKKKFEFPVPMRKGVDSPGPANYKSLISRQRNISMGKFNHEKKETKSTMSISPGPSAYATQRSQKCYIQTKFRKKQPPGFDAYSSRKQFHTDMIPSPGSYPLFSEFAVRDKPDKKINHGRLEQRLKNLATCPARAKFNQRKHMNGTAITMRMNTQPNQRKSRNTYSNNRSPLLV